MKPPGNVRFDLGTDQVGAVRFQETPDSVDDCFIADLGRRSQGATGLSVQFSGVGSLCGVKMIGFNSYSRVNSNGF